MRTPEDVRRDAEKARESQRRLAVALGLNPDEVTEVALTVEAGRKPRLTWSSVRILTPEQAEAAFTAVGS